ncbi:iron complex transport system ATP-binding protein [Anaerobacterium chartisolvens]|uniref:Iron complex transport system ATP-binding protein n=1 Tax=Anaerobacterium chartisolvens TaxID=1297424 RepID=A0A369BFB6_9FIRM|nr:ABC transporter ATP-binding protein [Anaerobacterium chartisolvens]RCX20111.1 iron complex transport system ATP-binding protein [Anaerobacterium chartisolvens]
MNENNKLLISVKGLDWNYGEDRVLENVTLDLYSNGFYGIIGPNGSGKTTLLKNISRSLITKKGKVFLSERDITEFSNKELAKKISYVPQNTNLEFEFSVTDIVLMGRSPYLKRFQCESTYDMGIAKYAMQVTDIWHLRHKNIGMVSGGERQRVIIARALAQQADVMLLDEPVSQLDIHHQIEILEILKKLTEDNRLTVVMSIHDLNMAAQYCERLILMDKGRIFKEGGPHEVIVEENIRRVYGLNAFIMKNPLTDKPHLIPLRKTW